MQQLDRQLDHQSTRKDRSLGRRWITIFFPGLLLGCLLLGWLNSGSALAQETSPTPVPAATQEETTEAPGQVSVEPTAQDVQIDDRITSILEATEWFNAPRVVVRDGVVFLDGQADSAAHREWAGNLARNTQDVVAVVNRMEIAPTPLWDLTPARNEIMSLWRGLVQSIPLLVFGIAILVFTWWLAEFVSRLLRPILQHQLGSPLLVGIASRTISIPIFLIGLYLVLQVAGLTQLALTILGGTGLFGIVVGFAFRDIAENLLASVLLSMHQPFQTGDLIDVAGYQGIVQQMNTRSTVLMTLEGNHVQIPNAMIFKSTIMNYTANPNRRSDFAVGIGYDSPILAAQETIAKLLREHEAVLQSPEPLVLVEALGAATVNLRIYFWCDASQYAPLKIKSSLVRLTKRALEDAGISMPDEAREVIFPQGVPLVQGEPAHPKGAQESPHLAPSKPQVDEVPEPVSSSAEGNLRSEDAEIREQAEQSRNPEAGSNLLEERP